MRIKRVPLYVDPTLNRSSLCWQDGDKPDADIIQYDLLSTVTHIRNPRTGGNLVSHIKGMEVYHQRKEKVTCLQWYLFNDFSITPIEQVRLCRHK